MVLDLYDSARETRDNLGSTDENKNLILLGAYRENLGVEMGSTMLTITNIGNSFVLGHPTNAILGTQKLGSIDYGNPGIIRVVNPNNIFHEHFRFDDFNSTDSTGTFSTTYFNVSMDNGENFITNPIFKNLQSINYVTIFVDLTGTKTQVAVGTDGGQLITITEGT